MASGLVVVVLLLALLGAEAANNLEVSKCTTRSAQTHVLSPDIPTLLPTTPQGGRVYHGTDAAPGAAEQDQEPLQVWQGGEGSHV
jgi:hypothetical protein